MIVVAHRGWPQRYSENTLASFRGALALGVDAIEFDVRLTRDGRLAVIHDADTQRTTGAPGLVAGMTLDEVKRLDAGARLGPAFAGERTPVLEEVLELVAGRAALAIEVKPPGAATARTVEALIPILAAYAGKFIIHSFDAEFLRAFRAASPKTDTGLLCAASDETIALARDIGCTAIHPEWGSMTPELNAAIRRAGLRIMVWTARTEADCAAILDHIDTDSVAADCPDILLHLLRRDAR